MVALSSALLQRCLLDDKSYVCWCGNFRSQSVHGFRAHVAAASHPLPEAEGTAHRCPGCGFIARTQQSLTLHQLGRAACAPAASPAPTNSGGGGGGDDDDDDIDDAPPGAPSPSPPGLLSAGLISAAEARDVIKVFADGQTSLKDIPELFRYAVRQRRLLKVIEKIGPYEIIWIRMLSWLEKNGVSDDAVGDLASVVNDLLKLCDVPTLQMANDYTNIRKAAVNGADMCHLNYEMKIVDPNGEFESQILQFASEVW
jgi:hypothetical protein